jgi:hypothetical protein
VRTWVMRGTLHLVPAADVRWLVDLFGPMFIKAGRRRRQELGLDDETCRRGLAAIERALVGAGPLSRTELVRRIAADGVRLDPKSQAPAHLTAYAALRGLICRGPDGPRDEPTYVLLDQWSPGGVTRPTDEALAELARRYLAGHGPAAPVDLAAWSGLPMSAARKAFASIADELVEVVADSAPAAVLTAGGLEPPDHLPPRLLGHFDAYLLGYRSREPILERRYAARIRAGGGMIRPAVVVGGRVVGTWRLERGRERATVIVEPFTRLPVGSRAGLRTEADDIGRFLGCEVATQVSGG